MTNFTICQQEESFFLKKRTEDSQYSNFDVEKTPLS